MTSAGGQPTALLGPVLLVSLMYCAVEQVRAVVNQVVSGAGR